MIYSFKFILFFFAALLYFDNSTASGRVNYQFHWLSIPIANLSISYDNSIIGDERISFIISTRGLLKIYRNYKSETHITRLDRESWNYNLIGIDRGQPEEKSIIYFSNKPPIIKKFIDDRGVKEIDVIPSIDSGSIDPFSILALSMSNLKENNECSSMYSIFDGKRRYSVKSTLVSVSDHKNKYEKLSQIYITSLESIPKKKKLTPKINFFGLSMERNRKLLFGLRKTLIFWLLNLLSMVLLEVSWVKFLNRGNLTNRVVIRLQI